LPATTSSPKNKNAREGITTFKYVI